MPKSELQALVPSGHRVERAAGDFRRGVPVIIRSGASERALAVAAETVTDATLTRLADYDALALILTHARAATLKIRLYTDEVVSVGPPASLARLNAVSIPSFTWLASSFIGPVKPAAIPKRISRSLMPRWGGIAIGAEVGGGVASIGAAGMAAAAGGGPMMEGALGAAMDRPS